jgi:predicted transcriptional regulator
VYLLTEELVRRGILEENVMAKDVSRYFLTEEGTQFYDRMVDYFDINLRSLQERE